MPKLRKISRQQWDVDYGHPHFSKPPFPFADKPVDIEVTPMDRDLRLVPLPGQIVRLRHSDVTGVVVATSVRRDGIWTHVELWTCEGTLRVSKANVECVVGRAKGISRIDQETRMYHGYVHGGQHAWFARVAASGNPRPASGHRAARLFSDGVYGDRTTALHAALAWLTEQRQRTS